MTAPPQRLLIVLWSCGPDRPGGAALVAAPLVYALAARALDVEVELHFAASTVRWLLDDAAAKATRRSVPRVLTPLPRRAGATGA